ncbi:hypothetical protein TorRG33x02_004770 [Trema orientale]|uniref:Uncharacterized protein n=1 Tax=Trema orientale TaxID=63057 RepID=A0A2P5G283_TREOI|nr:hypothetical protein TorRG33x02_004770 [Trema orientale]
MNQEANHLTTDLEEERAESMTSWTIDEKMKKKRKTEKGRGDSLRNGLLLRLRGCFLRHCRPRLRLTELVEPEQLVVLSSVSTNTWPTLCFT